MNPTLLLTVDVEDWFQVENFKPYINRAEWEQLPARVAFNTTRLLDLFEGPTKKVKATFFVLGWVAERFPELIREIAKRGHEVASHGYDHALCGSIDTKSLRADLKKSKSVIERITGMEVLGYRAPSFSVSDDILALIMQAGYRYDSSYNSFSRHGRYGSITAQGHPKAGIALRIAPGFYELPISNLEFGWQTLPWGGGGYFRLLPFSIFKKGVQHILKRQHTYMFYMHPWEVDPGQPRVKAAKGTAAFRHYLNLSITHDRLRRLIRDFFTCDFITCSQYLDKLEMFTYQKRYSGVRS